jgi:LmbE family N-acetylglucosaminyl deacetylase
MLTKLTPKKLTKKWQAYLYFGLIAFFILSVGSTVYYKYFGTLPDPLALFIEELPAPTKDDRILVITPHPDDETIGAGGYINIATRNGAALKIICATDGDKRKQKEIRHGEINKAVSILGVKKDFLKYYNYPDGKLANYKGEFKEKLLSDIRDFNPTVVINPMEEDSHLDHKITANVIAELIKENKDLSFTHLEFLIHFKYWPRPKGLYIDNHLLPPVKLISIDKKWRKFMLDESAMDAKHEAILQYKSQLKYKPLRLLIQSSIRKNELFTIKEIKRNEIID